jgi:hypothetical protein
MELSVFRSLVIHANSIWQYLAVYLLKMVSGQNYVLAVTMRKRRILAWTVS